MEIKFTTSEILRQKINSYGDLCVQSAEAYCQDHKESDRLAWKHYSGKQDAFEEVLKMYNDGQIL